MTRSRGRIEGFFADHAARFATLVLLALLPDLAAAQGVQTGSITGTMTAADGTTLPGITIAIRSPALQGERPATTDSHGSFIVKGLPPGRYVVTLSLEGMKTVEKTLDLVLGGAVRFDARMEVAPVAETIQVTAEAPSAMADPVVRQTYTAETINALPTGRTLSTIAELAPGVTDNAPNPGQLTISGGFGYDNVFLVDGVDVDDNLFGTPQNLFIEDAIEETQVLTSGISAEYGRFSGGVVNAITKRGGNLFSGSFRSGFSNASWRDETPLEKTNGIERESNLNEIYEATFGGPIVKDKLWFFFAGRHEGTSQSDVLQETGIAAESITDNSRFEGKLTGNINASHTIQATFTDNSTEFTGPSLDFSYSGTLSTFVTRKTPNRLFALNYTGTLKPNLFVEAQYSRRTFRFEGAGGTSTDIHDSPFFSLGATAPPAIHYNAPYFDATDPEDRNNEQLTGNVSYFLSTDSAGKHDFKVGLERFKTVNTGGNSQSATGYVFDADYITGPGGEPILNAAEDLTPDFVPGESQLENWIAVRGAELEIKTTSLFLNDAWALDKHWAFNLGLRYEKVRSDATGGIVGVDTNTLVPRLGTTFDLKGDGRLKLFASYAHYAGRYNEAQFSANTNVANPSVTVGIYNGPAGSGRDFAPGFDPANYEIVFGRFPTANVSFEDGLSSPVTREFSLGAGTEFTNGFVRASYTHRDVHGFIEDFINLGTGSTEVVVDGINYGTFANSVYRNSDLPDRRYQALVFQARYAPKKHFAIEGHWTVQLENDGNYEGEGTNLPATTSVIGDYPELLTPDRHFPSGHLNGFQRNKVRLFATYDFDFEKAGNLTAGVMWRIDSGLSYSLIAQGVGLTDTQFALDPGYASLPADQDIYFGKRGDQKFDGSSLFDLAITYKIPVWRTLSPWLKFDVRNLFNSHTLIKYNTTVTPNFDGPVDALGLPTEYIRGANFGEASSNADYVLPREFLFVLGMRF